MLNCCIRLCIFSFEALEDLGQLWKEILRKREVRKSVRADASSVLDERYRDSTRQTDGGVQNFMTRYGKTIWRSLQNQWCALTLVIKIPKFSLGKCWKKSSFCNQNMEKKRVDLEFVLWSFSEENSVDVFKWLGAGLCLKGKDGGTEMEERMW